MKDYLLSLNGDWYMQYLGKDYCASESLPEKKDGYIIKNAVPNYWEDMMDDFRANPMHTELNYNPNYTLQRYPQTGYVPDMVLPNVLGSFMYKKTFSVQKENLVGDIELYVGGVQNTLSAWLNDKFISTHVGYSSDFSFSIDKDLFIDGENEITLVVTNGYPKGYKGRPVSGLTNRAANECTGGVYGSVEIRVYPDGLKGAHVSTAKDLATFTVQSVGAIDKEKTVVIKDGERVVFEKVIPSGESEITLSTKDMEFWSPSNSKLYTLSLSTKNQHVTQKFGLRRLDRSSDGKHLVLNGKPFFFRGVCEHTYFAKTVHPVKDTKYYRAVIKKLKSLGFNSLRFHTNVPMAEYMQSADELGILIEVETPNNTSVEEWRDIVRYTRDYTSVVMYSSGNEMIIDEDYIEHLRECASIVHTNTDSMFSPMSAMRGIEYFSYGDDKVDLPFPHNPVRLKKLSEFCDAYNTYSVGRTSYWSEKGDPNMLDERNSIYDRPLLSHEICIQGTYCDLSLKDRYKGTRIGDTELFTSVEKHLSEKGLLDRAPKYYANSVEWQKRLRKHCFETVRRSKSFSGYDFLGDIDTHWHTFGYCVGMMNEFYELKAGETRENVLRYNSDVVILADLPVSVNYLAGQKVNIPIVVSNYAQEDIKNASLTIRVMVDGKVYTSKSAKIPCIKAGEVDKVYDFAFTTPKCDKPIKMILSATLDSKTEYRENEWELYAFPKAKAIPSQKTLKQKGVLVANDLTYDELKKALDSGKKVVMFGAGPLVKINTAFQMALAGRTEGHLATVINDHPLMEDFPSDGFCGWQFRNMLNEGYSVALDLTDIEYKPIIEIASSYKYARREALMVEYKVGKGKLFICTLNLPNDDNGANYLKSSIINYALSEKFDPEIALTSEQFYKLCHSEPVVVIENTNEAFNANDITM